MRADLDPRGQGIELVGGNQVIKLTPSARRIIDFARDHSGPITTAMLMHALKVSRATVERAHRLLKSLGLAECIERMTRNGRRSHWSYDLEAIPSFDLEPSPHRASEPSPHVQGAPAAVEPGAIRGLTRGFTAAVARGLVRGPRARAKKNSRLVTTTGSGSSVVATTPGSSIEVGSSTSSKSFVPFGRRPATGPMRYTAAELAATWEDPDPQMDNLLDWRPLWTYLKDGCERRGYRIQPRYETSLQSILWHFVAEFNLNGYRIRKVLDDLLENAHAPGDTRTLITWLTNERDGDNLTYKEITAA